MGQILKQLFNENPITLLADHIPTFSVEKYADIEDPAYTSVTVSFSQWNLDSKPWLYNCNPKVDYNNLQ